MIRVIVAGGIVATLGAWAARTDAADVDAGACIDAHVAVQEKRLAGDLLGARKAADVCREDGCPELPREECKRWAEDLDGEVPALTVQLKNVPPGAAPTLTVDGHGAEAGAAVPSNPGAHSIVVVVGDRRVRRSVHLLKGQREVVTVDLSPDAPAPSEAESKGPRAQPRERGVPIGPIVLGSLGVVGLSTFAIAGGLGMAEYDQL